MREHCLATRRQVSKPLLLRSNSSVPAKTKKRKIKRKKTWCDDLSVHPAVISHTHYSSVKWRQSQFKNPDESYKYRCRAEPQNVSQPVSQPSSVVGHSLTYAMMIRIHVLLRVYIIHIQLFTHLLFLIVSTIFS